MDSDAQRSRVRDDEGSGVDTLLAVYTGSAVDALTEVASNDDAPNATRKTSDLTFAALKDTTYYIAIDGFTGRGGTLVLAWLQGPENDDFAFAAPLEGVSGRVLGTTRGATDETLNPGPSRAIWYRWVAPASMNVLLDTRGSRESGGQLDTFLAVYRGDNVATLRRVAFNDDLYDGVRYDLGAVLSFNAVRGTVYHFALAAYDGSTVLRWAEGVLLRGNARRNKMTGTAGKDIFISGGGADVIRGLGGDDEIVADGGDDRIFAGAGADAIWAGAGDDLIRGDAGNDRIMARDGVRGNDSVLGGSGRDTCGADRDDRKVSCP